MSGLDDNEESHPDEADRIRAITALRLEIATGWEGETSPRTASEIAWTKAKELDSKP